MNTNMYFGPDLKSTSLREAIATITREFERLPSPPEGDPAERARNDAKAALADLVSLLALGPEPELRACPECLHIGMRDATRCGYCWAKLPPLGASTLTATLRSTPSTI